MSSQKTVYQTYFIRSPRRSDLGDAPYLLRQAGQGGYRFFVDVETLLGALQKELTPASRQRNKGFRYILKGKMDGLVKYPGRWRAFWKRKAVVAPAQTQTESELVG